MDRPREITGSLLAHNTVLNFIGMVVPLIVAVFSMPFVIKGLGTERFGILSLSWVVLGYFGLFDLGLSQATTKFVAEALGRNEVERLPRLVWTALGLQVILGIIGCLLCITCIPFLVGRVLNVPTELVGETKSVFLLMALSLPIVLGTGSLRGVLSAAQRFDLVNVVKIPSSCLIYLLPALALPFALQLPVIIFLLVLVRFINLLAYLLLCIKVFPVLRHNFSFDSNMIKPLLTFGGWLTVSSVVGPVLVSLDRFLIGSLLTMAAVAYYTAPYEMVSRLWVISGSLLMTLFPAFSALWGMRATKELERLYVRAVKYLLLVVGPLALLLILFASDILRLWLGTEFAQKSALLLQILTVGIFINSLAQVPYSLVQGFGRPDITAKFHLLETPIYIATAWFLIKSLGIAGAALAWSLRVAFDALLLFGVTWKIRLVTIRSFIENGFLWSLGGLSLLAGMTLPTLLFDMGLSARITLIIPAWAMFAIITWRYALDNTDKGLFISLISRKTSGAGVVK
jgi:O-antigen/teichoic acid export membrane protein